MNGSDPAFPTDNQQQIFGGEVVDTKDKPGFTKREWLTGMAMQGILSAMTSWPHFEDKKIISETSLMIADALIAELSKEVKA